LDIEYGHKCAQAGAEYDDPISAADGFF